MRISSLSVAALLFLAIPLSAQTTFQVSRGKPAWIFYTGMSSGNPMFRDPSKLVDGISSVSSSIELLPGNEGSRIVLSLGDTFSIVQVTLHPMLVSAIEFRLHGYEIRTSVDSLVWDLWFADSANTRMTIDTIVTPRTVRWFELRITHQDLLFSTALSEIALSALITRPIVTSISVQVPPTDTTQYQRITWTTALWDTFRTVTISAGRSNGAPVVVASGVPNVGSYSWRTSVLPDGSYRVRVAPDTVSGLSAEAFASVSNFLSLSADIYTPAGAEYASTYPPLVAPPIGDSITFRSTASPRHAFPYTRHLEWSADSGRSWIPVMDVASNDTLSIRVPASQLTPGVLYGFLRLGIFLGTQSMTTVSSHLPLQTAALPPYTSLRHWITGREAFGSGTAFPAMPLSYRDRTGTVVLSLMERWVVNSSFDTLRSHGTPSSGSTRSAAGDIDADGTVELVSATNSISTIISRPELGEPPFLVLNTTSHELFISDLDGDDTLEVGRTVEGFGFYPINSRGELTARFDINSLRAAAVVDMSGDAKPEIAAITSTAVTVFNSQGQAIPGYPTTLASTTLRWALPYEADGDPKSELLVIGSNHIYVLNDSASVQPEFPLVLGGSILQYPIVVDLDRDGHDDFLFGLDVQNNGPMMLHCFNRHGQPLPGWPRVLPGDHRATVFRSASMYAPAGIEVLWFRTYPSILAASVDGDLSPEIIVLGSNGLLTIFRADGSTMEGYPVFLGSRSADVPLVGDFDDDGALDLVYRIFQEHPVRYTFVNVEFAPGSDNANATPWPMYMANPQRTGKGFPTIPVGVRDLAGSSLPAAFSLAQNYPNPFNPSTTIEYSIPRDGHVSVRVFNMLGQCVETLVDGVQTSGTHRSRFTADHLPSGVYIVSVAAGSDRASHKILLMK